MTDRMDAARAAAILAAYGADPARWPLTERAGLTDWLARHPEALAAERGAAAALDADLDLLAGTPDADPLLAARVLAVAPRPKVAPMAAALAACTLLGVAMGFAQADGVRDADAAFAAAFPDMDAGGGP